jgi:hypothetical protein
VLIDRGERDGRHHRDGRQQRIDIRKGGDELQLPSFRSASAPRYSREEIAEQWISLLTSQ